MRLGGPAQYFLTPRSVDELRRVLKACADASIAVHVLGGGSNLLVRDEGVSGAVVRLSAECFNHLSIQGTTVVAGAGTLLSHVVSETVRVGLTGFEPLSGIPGTVGGAVRGNAGGRHGEIGPLVSRLQVLNGRGELLTRTREQLTFNYRETGLDELIVTEAEFELATDDPHEIVQRLRKIWVMKKASQPLSSQSAGCIFKNPRGQRAGELIENAGLKGTRIGGAEINDRHANFIVTHDGCRSNDVLRLIEIIRSKIAEQFGVHLELEVKVW